MPNKSTVLVQKYRNSAREKAGENSYKGYRIHALKGLHAHIGKKAVEYFDPGATLLELAAGTGAMSLRMLDLGFQVVACDYVEENFKLRTIPLVQVNLNEAFSSFFPQRFDAIIASEIIEHLENPRNFARECFQLLKPGGRIILSTPNLECAKSKAIFLRSGFFLWFEERHYEGDGHITPLTQWQINNIFSEAGLMFLWKGSFGSRPGGSRRTRILSWFINFLSDIKLPLDGEIFIAVIEKPHDKAL